MAAAAIAESKVFRCPVCLTRQTVMPGTLPQSRLTCPKCGRAFERQEGLPFSEPAATGSGLPASRVEAPAPVRWSGHVAIVALGLAIALGIGKDKRGPEFLMYYFIVWLVTMFGSLSFKF